MSRLLLPLIAALLPFQIATNLVAGADVALIRLLVLAAALAWLWHIVCSGAVSIPASALTILLPLLLAATFFSLLAAADPSWFARKFIFLCNFAVLPFIILGTRHATGMTAMRLLRIATASGAVAAACALVLWGAQFVVGADAVLGIWRQVIAPLFLGQVSADTVATYSSAFVAIGGTDYLRLVGFFPDPHVAAFFFEILFPFAVAFAIGTTGRQRRLWTLAALLLAAATLATFTRGAYVGLAAGGMVWLLVATWRICRDGSARALTTILFTLITTTILVLTTPIGARLGSMLGGHDTSITERFVIWHEAVTIIEDRPLLGTGLGNYPLAVAQHADLRDPYYAHNLYLDIAAETGLITLVIWLTLMTWALWRMFRYHIFPSGIAAASAILTLSVHGLFDTMIWSVHVLPLIMILLTYAASDAADDIPYR